MNTYELVLGAETLDEVLDRIAADATFAVPGLGRERARAVADVVFRSRATQTVACGRFADCQPDRSLWGDRPPPGGSEPPCRWSDIDPYDLPNVFAVAAADAMDLVGDTRDAAEERLASVFRAALASRLFFNQRCGHSPACSAAATDPFLSTLRRHP